MHAMKVNLKLLTAQIAGMFVVIALALFLAAGTVGPRALVVSRARIDIPATCPSSLHKAGPFDN
jgi:hypothetical protein